MSPFTLLVLSSEMVGSNPDASPDSATCGTRSERRWALWACAATGFVLTLTVLALHLH